MATEKEEILPITPISSAYLLPEIEQIMFCALGLANPIDVDAVKSAFSNSILVKHPRFSSLAIKDHRGRDRWKRLPSVDMDDHIIIHHHHAAVTTSQEKEDAVNAYIADIAVSTPMNRDKPLWDLHLLVGLDCLVLRVHHSIGDGESLMSMLSLCFSAMSADGAEARKYGHDRKRQWRDRGLWSWIKSLWFTLIFALELIGIIVGVKDKETVISGGDGVELWPRKVLTAEFKLEDMKAVKQDVPNVVSIVNRPLRVERIEEPFKGSMKLISFINHIPEMQTINDVLLGVISHGLSKYLNLKSPKGFVDNFQLTCTSMVNMRRGSLLQEDILGTSKSSAVSGWGNKTSIFLVPILIHNGLHPLQQVRRIKAIMDRKKQSFTSHLVSVALRMHSILSLLGSRVSVWFSRRFMVNTTFLVSNIVGPRDEIAVGGNPVTYIRLTISSLPYAIVMHMVSYAGKGHLQLIFAKDIVHDPEYLAKCFEVSLSEMVNTRSAPH